MTTINAVHDLPSIAQAIRWHHASLGFLVKDTLNKAIANGHFDGWPLLTQHNVSKHYPESDETIMGHTNQQRQGVRSTKPKTMPPDDGNMSNTPQVAEHSITATIYQLTNTIYSDQTGRFPCRSKAGNEYIMVILHTDSNYVFVAPMKNKSDEEQQRTYRDILQRMKERNLTINKHILDNECSNAMKQLITQTCKYELVPPGIHRRNRVEVTIKSFKHHLIAIFAGLDGDFPMSQWDKLLPHIELTLNLLRKSKIDPSKSAYEQVYGKYDYDRHPLAPIGCPVQLYNQPHTRTTWAPHTQQGWYLGPSMEHYRCHRVLPKATNTVRVCETVIFKHKRYTSPTISPTDYITDATQQLITTIKKAEGIPGYATSQLEQLEQLTDYFQQRMQQTTAVPNDTRKHTTLDTIPTMPKAYPKPPSPMERFIATFPAPAPPAPAPPTTRELGPIIPGGNTGRVSTRSAHVNTITTWPSTQHEYLNGLANAIFDEQSGKMLNYRQLLTHPNHKDIWTKSSADEFGRLAQGVGGRIEGTNTIYFIPYNKIPRNR